MKIFHIALLLVVLFSMVRAQEEETEPGKTVPPEPIEHENGDQVLEQLQGGFQDLFIVIFYVDEEKATEVETDITEKVVGGDYPWARVTKVDLTKVQEYYNLFRTIELEGEPKRGHSEPIVLVMKQGEGFTVRGPSIVDGIIKRAPTVQDGTVYGPTSDR